MVQGKGVNDMPRGWRVSSKQEGFHNGHVVLCCQGI